MAADLKIFANNVEESAMEIINSVATHPYFTDKKIRIMPDTHAGAGIVIGFTCPMGEYVNPEHIGVDIGCGIEIEMFDKVLSSEDYPLFEQRIRNAIPMGFNLNEKSKIDLKEFCRFVRRELYSAEQASAGLVHEVPFSSESDIADWCKSVNIDTGVFYKSLGTLGGGNHFIELDYNEEMNLMGATVHTGSRNLGVKVCAKWKKKCVDDYLSGEDLEGYLTDMVICQAYAKYNRKIILEQIADIYKKLCKGRVVANISSIHNYLDFEDGIIRKGAIRSYKYCGLVIPFNMRDGIAICEGKSNEDWNCSAPHGAGRILSRSKAKEQVSMESFQESMKGIYSTSICPETLDESPMAYKDTEEIIKLIEPTCEIKYMMKPVINIKDTGRKKN